MIKKIIKWFKLRKKVTTYEDPLLNSTYYTLAQLENAYKLGYTDGKRDGLTIAREQATKSLKEILKWQQK
jgi:hypothetical protein